MSSPCHSGRAHRAVPTRTLHRGPRTENFQPSVRTAASQQGGLLGVGVSAELRARSRPPSERSQEGPSLSQGTGISGPQDRKLFPVSSDPARARMVNGQGDGEPCVLAWWRGARQQARWCL